MELNDPIYVAGHRGLVGSAVVKKLTALGYCNLILRSSQECDLTRQAQVEDLFAETKPRAVIVAAAKVGGIYANQTYPAEFIYQNGVIASHVIHTAYQSGVERLIYLGSSCIYPRDSSQPIPESALLSGPLEPTNRAYAVAKILGIELCRSYNAQYGTRFLAVMPTNLYGPNDTYHPEN
ncbi:MAG: NAD-dependent epimerase/dehydratase family protein, partial [Chlamydiia bacterium]|nr:NAD-dependent epimerase/dehydratase family protein [Chlamydiia bacterium]